ncbi:hypothetical protein M0802_016918 [Mischocyttarus mexicanus]|nr:hypothetical protein M0802_016918 [Mischocyttarus mexicanus]
MWRMEETKISVLHKNTFKEEIDLEASRLFKLVPEYDPGAGSVSVQCKRDADIFHRELNKFTLWALTRHRVPRFSTVNWAVCTPASCSSRDVEISLRDTLSKYTSQTGLQISVRVDREMCQVKNNQPLQRETIFVSEILLSFSIKRNFNKLISLDIIEDDIASLHGVRAFNALMLLLAHKSMALFFNPYSNRTEMSEYLGKPWTVIGRAASLYTDPFIMLSGLLTSYSFIGKMKKTGHLDIKKEYLARILRLVPTLGALILFCTYVMPYLGSGPQWNLVVTQHANICKQNWWKNFLFIHNYFGFENMVSLYLVCLKIQKIYIKFLFLI